MPYYITKDSEDCAGWAVVKDDMEQLGCHLTKSAAIEQMVAISQEEGIEPGGELEIEDDMEMSAAPVKLTAQVTIDAAAPDGTARRTISGIAVPYGQVATVNDGQKIRIEAGALPVDGKAPKLFMYHDASQPVGLVTGRVDTDEGMLFQAKIAKTALGDEALQLAQEGVLDSVSVGINPKKFSWDGDVMVVKKADWMELSLVPIPAFAGASITDIAASANIHHNEEQISNTQDQPQESEPQMSEQVEAPAVIEASSVQTVFAQARSVKLPSPAEYIAAFVRGGHDFAQMNAHIQAAAPNITTTDTPGILPEVIVGPVYDGLNPIRPFVSAIGSRAMPSVGATFRRPVITARPTVTEQPTGQNNTLDPSLVTVSNNDVSKKTFGTYVTMSEQDLDWTDPASLNIVLDQLAIAYGQATDNYAVDNCYSLIVQSETVTDNTDPEDWLAAIFGGAKKISQASNYLPTHMVLDPTAWSILGKLVGTDGRPVFPMNTPINGIGTLPGGATSWNGNPLGLTLVVDKNLPSGACFIGHLAGPAAGYEFYEQIKGAISIDEPSKLARTIAFRGYAAGFMADATKLCKLTI